METIHIEEDIKVLYVTASAFPDGIEAAQQKLHRLIGSSSGRHFWGVSRPEQGAIVYRAAATESYPGEAEALHCETLVLRKGRYCSKVIRDYARHIDRIGKAFDELLEQAGLDPNGYCVEWYFNETDVRCMIRMEQAEPVFS